jgi:tRNA threonylcarbamoyladenosine modification (KEOPS) complex Cgi121 subunit
MARAAEIKGSSWAVCIGGFSCAAGDVNRLISSLDGVVPDRMFQLFDADMVAGWEHLYMAAVNAVKAYEMGGAVSKSLPVEVLLYASCSDQIKKAILTMGVTASTGKLALVVMAPSKVSAEEAYRRAARLLGVEDDGVLDVTDEKFERLKSAYGIGDGAIEAVGGDRLKALTSLIVERGALSLLRR